MYPCKECGRKVPIRSKGLCPSCRERQRRADGEETMHSKNHSIRAISNERKKKLKEKKSTLDPFFDYHIAQIQKNPVCQNCGDYLQGLRSEVAHVLPKRSTMNPEVMNHLDNALYLCCQFSDNNCHKKFDDTQASENVYSMTVWEKAVNQYLKLKPFLINVNKITENFEKYLSK